MNPSLLSALLIAAILGVAVAVLLSRQRAPLTQAGETLVLGPQYGGFFKNVRGVISFKTMAMFALTDLRVVIRPLLVRDIEIPLSCIIEVTENVWSHGNYRGGQNFLILRLKDGGETAFMVKDPDRWREEITARLS
jgi:hypothetical protein